MDPLRIYDYLVLARARVFDAVRVLSREQYHRTFPFGLKTIASTITHLMISEWYYLERIEGRVVPAYEKWPIRYENPPEAFETIERGWGEQAKRIRAVIEREVRANSLGRRITWLSFPDDAGRRFHITATVGDFLAQLALHEVHHRSQVMVMLRLLRPPHASDAQQDRPPLLSDIDYNAMMFERIPHTSS